MSNTPIPTQTRVFCIGENVIDELHHRNEVISVPGGCTTNGAVMLGSQGINAAVLSPISIDEYANAIIQHLERFGVDTSHLHYTDAPTTRVIIPINEDHDGGYYLADGDSAQMHWNEVDVFDGPTDGDILLVSGSFSLAYESIGDVFEDVFEEGSKYHVVFFDPNVRAGFIADDPQEIAEAQSRFDRWTEKSTIVKLSSEDAKWRYPDLQGREIVELLVGDTDKIVFLTDGPKSVVVGSKNLGVFEVEIEALDESEIVDTVGAGDTFNAGTLKWLIDHGIVSKSAIAKMARTQAEELVRDASKLAAQVCKVAGANPPLAQDLRGDFGGFGLRE